MYLSEVQVQMVDVAAYHGIKRHTAAFVINPIVVEFGLVNRTDDVADVLIVQLQQHHKQLPLLMLIVLKSYPQVVVLRVIREDEHCGNLGQQIFLNMN